MLEESQVSTTNGGFKSQAWNKMSALVTRECQGELNKQGFVKVTKAQLQSKYAELERKILSISPIGVE